MSKVVDMDNQQDRQRESFLVRAGKKGYVLVKPKKETREWRKVIEEKESNIERLECELQNHQQMIKERAFVLQRELKCPLFQSIHAETNLDLTIKALLGTYEESVKDVLSLRDQFRGERKRRIELEDALRDQKDSIHRRWSANDSMLRAQHSEELARAYANGREAEKSIWNVAWAKLKMEHGKELELEKQELEFEKEAYANQSLLYSKEQAERRAIESTARALEIEVATAQSKHGAEVDRITVDHNRKLGRLERDLEAGAGRHASEMRILEGKHSAYLLEKEREHEGQMKSLDVEIARLKTEHQSKLETIEEEHEKQMEDLEGEHEKELKMMESATESLKKGHNAELKSQAEQSTQDMSKLREDIISLKEAHTTELNKRETSHHSEILKMRGEMASLMEGHATELKIRDQTHAGEMSKLKKQFKEYLAQRESEHAVTENTLRNELGAYSGALLERDKTNFNMIEGEIFEPMLDADIEARFADLVEQVNALSRLEWKANPSGWTDEILEGLSSNQRLLRKQILQDTIWVLLHELVFCSPFRVFGGEGRELESKWNQECGADNKFDNGNYTWPKPSMETERWRYITIRECRAAIRKPIPSPYDPRAKLKKDFQASIERVKKELTTAVGALVALSQADTQALEKMSLRAARIWLEFGLQRFRVLVLVQGDKVTSVNEKIKRVEGHGLELVLAPKLERFGNAKGEDLEEEETISKDTGEVMNIVLKK